MHEVTIQKMLEHLCLNFVLVKNRNGTNGTICNTTKKIFSVITSTTDKRTGDLIYFHEEFAVPSINLCT